MSCEEHRKEYESKILNYHKDLVNDPEENVFNNDSLLKKSNLGDNVNLKNCQSIKKLEKEGPEGNLELEKKQNIEVIGSDKNTPDDCSLESKNEKMELYNYMNNLYSDVKLELKEKTSYESMIPDMPAGKQPVNIDSNDYQSNFIDELIPKLDVKNSLDTKSVEELEIEPMEKESINLDSEQTPNINLKFNCGITLIQKDENTEPNEIKSDYSLHNLNNSPVPKLREKTNNEITQSEDLKKSEANKIESIDGFNSEPNTKIDAKPSGEIEKIEENLETDPLNIDSIDLLKNSNSEYGPEIKVEGCKKIKTKKESDDRISNLNPIHALKIGLEAENSINTNDKHLGNEKVEKLLDDELSGFTSQQTPKKDVKTSNQMIFIEKKFEYIESESTKEIVEESQSGLKLGKIDASSPLIYKSRGLCNLGNTCYMNSVLQCLAHFHDLEDFGFVNKVSVSFFQLLSSMKNPSTNEEELKKRLKLFYRQLTDSSDNFEIGKQCDSKYLLIYLQQILIGERIPKLKLFKWGIKKNFLHAIKSKSGRSKKYTLHEIEYPEEGSSILTLNPKYTEILLIDFIKSFSDLICTKMPTGYCTTCNEEVEGQENLISIDHGKYINFATTSSNYTCDLSKVQTFSEHPYHFELCNVIMRNGYSNEFGHNYSICKEGSEWVICNDSNISKLIDYRLNGPYIFIFKVSLA